jgi:hypothetical protein
MANKQRDPRLEAFWRNVLAKFRDSALSVRAFCREQKLTEPAFYAWRRIIRERDGERCVIGGRDARRKEASRVGQRRPASRKRFDRESTAERRPVGPAFVPLAVCGTRHGGTEGSIIVELRGERALRVPLATSAERLAELVRALEAAVSEGQH